MLLQSGETSLFMAAQNGHVGVVEALLAAGANKEAARKVSGTPACMYPPQGGGSGGLGGVLGQVRRCVLGGEVL